MRSPFFSTPSQQMVVVAKNKSKTSMKSLLGSIYLGSRSLARSISRARSLSLALHLPLSLSLCLARCNIRTHAHAHALTLTHEQKLSLSLSRPRAHEHAEGTPGPGAQRGRGVASQRTRRKKTINKETPGKPETPGNVAEDILLSPSWHL